MSPSSSEDANSAQPQRLDRYHRLMQFTVRLDRLFILYPSCSPASQVNPKAGSSHPDPAASASSLPAAAIAFEEATANQEAEASHAGSESAREDDTAGDDAVFGHEDAWGFLQRLRVA